jgi:hypothetical protein
MFPPIGYPFETIALTCFLEPIPTATVSHAQNLRHQYAALSVVRARMTTQTPR